jgi:RHS repeat-associated protein
MPAEFIYDCVSRFMHSCVLIATRYTGKERDIESGNDYFGARYYASSMGRFMSPDWSDAPDTIPYGDLSNPQSLNLYSYVNNNPLSKTDDDGHVPCGGTASITINVNSNGTSSMSQSADDCPTLGFIDTLLFYRQRFINRVNVNADAHKPPPQPNNKGQALKDLNNIMMGAVPVGASARFGWKNGAKWRQAVKDLMKPGTHETIAGEVPTRAEASEMIEQGGGKISRGGEGDPNMDDGEKFGHPEGGVSDHNYPHINYETPSGVKATVKVQ